MATLKTKIGEIELKPGSLCEADMEILVESLIDVWEIAPELIDIQRMSNYFAPVSPEWFMEYASRYMELDKADFLSYKVLVSVANKYEVTTSNEVALLSADWWTAFSAQYRIKIDKEIANFFQFHDHAGRKPTGFSRGRNASLIDLINYTPQKHY